VYADSVSDESDNDESECDESYNDGESKSDSDYEPGGDDDEGGTGTPLHSTSPRTPSAVIDMAIDESDDGDGDTGDGIALTVAEAQMQELREEKNHKALLLRESQMRESRMREAQMREAQMRRGFPADLAQQWAEHDVVRFEPAEEFHDMVVRQLDGVTWNIRSKRLGPKVQKVTLGYTADQKGCQDWSRDQIDLEGRGICLWGNLRQLGLRLGATFSSIDIIKNTPRRIHTDDGNTGESLIVTFGKYTTGGKFEVWPGRKKGHGEPDKSTASVVHDPHYLRPSGGQRGKVFNGAHYHSACVTDDGDRYSVVYYYAKKLKRKLGDAKCPPSAAHYANQLKRADNNRCKMLAWVSR
jgi:hypothetical protein